MKDGKIAIGVLGVDHRHIYGMLEGMLGAGCVAVAWWTQGEPLPLAGFVKRFPDLPRVADKRAILEDTSIDLVLISCVPSDRAALAIDAMRHGKEVMLDKPGCVSAAELAALRAAQAETGRIWSVDFSERFEVPAVTKATELVAQGAIGRVVSTTGLGPHRHNPHTRAPWFYSRKATGGILCDIGSHQIDQFLYYTGSTKAEVVASQIANLRHPGRPHFQDFGDMMLRGDKGFGYVRLDWFTPGGLGTWGDGRLFVLGTDGYIEIRKYTDVAVAKRGNNLFVVDGKSARFIDCANGPLPFGAQFVTDIVQRTHAAQDQEQCLLTAELSIQAQMKAARVTVAG